MTMREVFAKIEGYNEIAARLGTDKARICFSDVTREPIIGYIKCGTYKEFSRAVRHEYQEEIAGKILKASNWEINGTLTVVWAGGIATYLAELTTEY